MAIKLITAQPGSYKTAMMMELAEKMANEGRPVYLCNIRGLKPAIPFPYQTIDHFKEWVDTPETSVIFIDEVQEFTRDVPTNAKTEELPKWMTLLEKHRHEGKDIFIVTQHPMFIHTHIRRLTSEHIHLVRNGNVPFSVKRMWGHVESDPDDMQKASIKSGCTTSIFRPKKEVFTWYESTVLDTHKFIIPVKLIKGIALVSALIGISAYFGYPVAEKYLNFGDKQITEQQKTEPTSMADIHKQQAELAGLTPEQYADLQNPEKRNAELQALNPVDMDTIVLRYNPNKPYDDYSQQVSYNPTAIPRFSGCMEKNGKYIAYTQQGTKLDVTQEDCKRLLEDGDRPFNYFAQEQTERVSTSEQMQTAPNTSSL